MTVASRLFKSVIIILAFIIAKNAYADSSKGSKIESFPRIMYGVSATDKNFKTMKEMGITHVHMYGLAATPLNESVFDKIENYLELARKHDLKVMFDLNGNERVALGRFEEMRELVQKYKNHPAIGIWYLSDEPDNHNISHHDLKPYYEMIKAVSPEIPIAVCHAWTTNWHRYNNVQDILLHDIYPVKESPFPNAKLENQTNFTRAALNQSRDKVTIPVIQFFSWASMSNYTSKRTMDHENNSPRYPTDVEFRYLCLSTIAQGVNGLAFYSHARSLMIDPTWIQKTASPIISEVITLTNAISSNQMYHGSHSDYRRDGYVLSEWKNNNKRFIILANTTSERKSIRYHKSLPLENMTPWGNTRNSEIKRNFWGMRFIDVEPWEVLIWYGSND